MAEITEVRIFRTREGGVVKAYASVTLDGEFVIRGLKVLEGENGLWVGMPGRKDRNGEFRDTFHPITREAREKLISAVLEEYDRTPVE